MQFLKVLAFAGLGIFVSAGANAAIVYDYGGTGPGLTTTGVTDAGDTGTLAPLLPGQAYDVTQITVARQNLSAAGSFDIGFFLYRNVDLTSNVSIFSNLAASLSFNRAVTAATAGQVFTTNITVTPGTLLLQGGQTFGYQMEYAAPGTINLTTAAYTPAPSGGAFYENHGPTVDGAVSPDVFFNDSDNDGKFLAADASTFGATNAGFNNVYLVITANVINTPEPTSIALLVPVGMMLVRRRRQA